MKRWRSEGAVLVLGVHLEEPHDGQPEDGEGGQLHRQQALPDDRGVLQDWWHRRDATHDRCARQELGEPHPPAVAKLCTALFLTCKKKNLREAIRYECLSITDVPQ